MWVNRRKTLVRIHHLYCDSCDFDFGCSLVTGPFLPRAVTVFLVVLLHVLRNLAWLSTCWGGSRVSWPVSTDGKVSGWEPQEFIHDGQKWEPYPIAADVLLTTASSQVRLSFSLLVTFGSDSRSRGPTFCIVFRHASCIHRGFLVWVLSHSCNTYTFG